MVERFVKTSKFLCWVLRHRPEKLGLALDPHGWIGISELIDGAEAYGVPLDRELIFEIVETDEKGRYQISADLKRIRARYGHSIPVELDIEPTEPPVILYHGTARHYIGSILHHGLHPSRRRFVHLSSDPGAASLIGGRHGEAIVLTIDAGRMHADGCELFGITKDIWLTRSVPAEYIHLDEAGEKPEEPSVSEPSPKKRVLFLCTGNQARSQIAEAILRRRAGDRFDVESAGAEPKERVHPLAALVLGEIGIDAADARPKAMSRFAGERFDIIITLCDRARDLCPVFPGRPATDHWNLADPASATGSREQRLEEFRRARDEIAARIESLIASQTTRGPNGRS